MIENSRVRQNMKFFRLHNGVDEDILPHRMQPAEAHEGPLRFVYIGNFEIARQLDVVFRAFDELESDNWRVDIFSADAARAGEVIRCSMRRRPDHVRILPAVDRAALFRELARYDVGLCLIPVNPLFLVSSPLKMVEYYACGIPAIMTPLPACIEAFGDRNCGFFTDFDPDSIRQTIRTVLSTDRSQLRRMGAIGREFVRAERNYRKIAGDLAGFLQSLRQDDIPATAHASRSRS
jgi:glycosyltransferase involved in cell wall biosynthesis